MKKTHIILIIIISVFIIGLAVLKQNSLLTKDEAENKDSTSTTSTSTADSFATSSQYKSADEQIVTVKYAPDKAYIVGAGFDHVTWPRLDSNNGVRYGLPDGSELLSQDNQILLYKDNAIVFSGQETYDANSWELIIPATCERYFDGCNTCTQGGGCTEMWCEVYTKPTCLDSALPPPVVSVPDTPVASPNTPRDVALVGRYVWLRTTEVGGAVVTPARPGSFSLNFEANGQLGIGTDCNAMSTTYSVAGDVLTISPNIATTLMYCENSQEQLFATMIGEAKSFELVSESILEIILNSGGVMELELKK